MSNVNFYPIRTLAIYNLAVKFQAASIAETRFAVICVSFKKFWDRWINYRICEFILMRTDDDFSGR